MNDDPISLLDTLKGASFEASLITTFNATLPFYEEVVLRRLISAGSRHNVVMMDAAQCARSWATPSLRPRFAGSAYTLLPLSAPGSFHPKITLLVGKKKTVLQVGSHNLTLSGYGVNREVSNVLEIAAASPPAHKLLLNHAWSLIQEWVRAQGPQLSPTLIASVMRIGELLPPHAGTASDVEDIRLLGQSGEGPSLLDQLDIALPRPPKQAVVVGAFFDQGHRFLKELESRWPDTSIRVVIDPPTVKFGRRPGTSRTQFVDARKLWDSHRDGYLHAKGLLLDFEDHLSLVTGSANPSAPAWLAEPRRNFEAMVLRPHVTLEESSFVRDLFASLSAPLMGQPELDAIPRFDSEDESSALDSTCPIVVAPLVRGTNLVVVTTATARPMTNAVIHFEGGTPPQSTTVITSPQGHAEVDLGSNSGRARWMEMSAQDAKRLIVIIHHEQAFQPKTNGSDRAKLRDALAHLDFSGANICELIAVIEKAIFDDEISVAHGAPGAVTAGGLNPAASLRPESLAVQASQPTGSSKHRRRVLQDGSLVDVLDALLHRLGVGLNTTGGGSGRIDPVSEEENIDNQQELPEDDSNADPTREAIALVRQRLKLIVKRMIKQLKSAVGAYGQLEQKAKAALGQLVAVLSLIREFRRLRHRPQWKPALGFLDEDCRRDLLTSSMAALFGSANGLARHVRVEGEDDPEELGQVRALLAWLAWDLGDAVMGPIEPMVLPEKKLKLANSYANLFELLPALALDDEAAIRLKESIRMTRSPTADEGARAESWLDYHLGLGLDLATAPEHTFNDRFDLHVGDLMRIPLTSPAQLRVVLEVTAQAVKLTEFDRERSFERFAGMRT